MGTARAVVFLVGALGPIGTLAAGQQAQAVRRPTPIPITGLARYEDRRTAESATEHRPVPAVEAAATLLRAAFARAGTKDTEQRVLVARGARQQALLVVVGTAEEVDVVRESATQLQLAEPVQARLQVSLLTLPAAVAREHGLQNGNVAAAAEAAIVALTRDAVKHGGSLRNLPEVAVQPLLPFVVACGKPGTEPPLRLRGEMLPLTAGKILVGMQLVRGELPEDPTRPPEAALATPVFRLEAGTAELVMHVDKDVATVLVVRCTELAPAPLPPPPAKR